MKRYMGDLSFRAQREICCLPGMLDCVKNNRFMSLREAEGDAAICYGRLACRNPINAPCYWLLVFLFMIFTSATFADDDLGRLFTTPEQRAAMEQLRYQKPVETITVPEIAFEE